MTRPRSQKNRHLPAHLYHDPVKGYRLTLVNGVRKTIAQDRATAVQIAVEYNRVMRPEVGITVDALIKASGQSPVPQEPFSTHCDRLLERATTEEQPSEGLMDTWQNDIVRMKDFFGSVSPADITLEHVNSYLAEYHPGASANVQNRKVSFLEKIFSYAIDESLMLDNPAARKKKRRLDPKQRTRLSMDAYKKIHAASPLWLQTAMDLSLQTTQARLEVSRIKYRISSPRSGVCGCVWLKEPDNGIFGTLFIHRQKTQEKEAAHVAIPIGQELKQIIDRSRDGWVCPYVVHRKPERANKQSKATDHEYQVDPNYLSRGFSKVRDKLGLFNHMAKEERPTFHEIRALSARLFDDQGIDPQGRMAHTDAKSTKVYTRNHLEWTEVPHAEILLG